MDLSLYEKMIGKGVESTSDAYVSDTIVHVNGIFNTSPSFKKIMVEDTLTDSIVSHTKKSTVLDVLFRPNTELNKGVYTLIESDTYIITDFVPNKIYPKAKVELCNSEINWNEGNDTFSYKCIVKASSFSETDERQASILQSELVVIAQYNSDTKRIRPTQRFVFGGNVYEVTTIDSVSGVYKEVGLIEFIVKFTSTSTTDDIDNKIADTSGNSGWGDWT